MAFIQTKILQKYFSKLQSRNQSHSHLHRRCFGEAQSQAIKEGAPTYLQLAVSKNILPKYFGRCFPAPWWRKEKLEWIHFHHDDAQSRISQPKDILLPNETYSLSTRRGVLFFSSSKAFNRNWNMVELDVWANKEWARWEGYKKEKSETDKFPGSPAKKRQNTPKTPKMHTSTQQ